ncbi:GlsB/YeaQ/YmgE family stress response membrane protein [Novilysobacter avium]|uniref:GlsB/YeaQ/YmgE family stress response membrane protein n=1 Tax=Novilysobacter avium TaxID=2781023 RepID=A0A7S6UM51_9GAMM|nr:GlsB/YeaQ/YmgE family stress response membrane protein [Lysobacter avium]QOW22764.1 GlsB/YeaQ/YmgE family stress response membrane protein [Lysobacter avium]
MFNGVLGYVAGGALIGILARLLKPGPDPMGWIMTIVLGIVGALAGSWLATEMGVTSRLLVWALAIIAAMVLLVVQDMVRERRRSTRR